MKKLLLLTIPLFLSVFVYGQNYNPFVAQGIVSPSPLLDVASNGTGQLSFIVGNSGDDPLVLVANDSMILTINLSNGVPNNLNPLAALGGSFASYFNWTYNAGSNSYTGVQNQTMPGALDPVTFGAGYITIEYKVTSNSVSSNPQNGFIVTVTPPAYTNTINTVNDDQVSSYTWTIPSCIGQGGADQAACEGGSATMNATASVGGYWTELTGNPGTSTITDPTLENTTITGFSIAGTYTYIWTNGDLCPDTVNVIVTAIPAAPTASVTQQPTCTLATGTAVVSSPAMGSGFEYAVDGGSYQASSTFTGLTPGTHSITVRPTANIACVSPETIVTVNPQPAPPAAPTLSASNVNNPCPSLTVNLNALVTSSLPSGAVLEWYTNNTHSGSAYASPATAGSGTYYAYYVIGGICFSAASTPVTVNVTFCCLAGNIAPITH